jgi:uncharacterized small protein (DUF1192 family)
VDKGVRILKERVSSIDWEDGEVDQKTFLRRVHKDPSLAVRIVQTISRRIRELDAEVTRLKVGG